MSSKTHWQRITTTTSGLLLLVVAVVCLNIIASKLFGRMDVTQDKVYSLSDGTRRILGKLDHDVTARLYFSRSIKDLPVVVKTYATRVEEVLGEYKAHSGGHMTVEVIDPKPDTDDEEWAQRYNLNGARLPRGDTMYFGVVFVAGSKEVAIPYLDPRREEFLEYDLSEALVRTDKKERAKIGIMSSLPIEGNSAITMGGDDSGGAWAFLADLKRNFDVQMVATTVKDIDQSLKALIIIHPKNLADATLYAIDQFVVGGGRVIAAVDPMSRTDLQINAGAMRGMGQMPQVASDLGKLFDAWGVEFTKGNMVGDINAATQINAGGPVISYPFYISLRGVAFSTTSPITASLHEMLYAEGGAFTKKKDSPFTFETLIKTSKESGTVSAAMAGFMGPQDVAKELKPDGTERTLAALVRGKFKSAFPGGRPADPAGDKDAKDKSASAPVRPHKNEADSDVSLVLIGDADFLADQNAADKLRFGSQVMVRARNDNLAFLFNAADALAGSEDLIAIRSRGRVARPFSRVAELQKNAQMKWQTEDEQLTGQLTDLQKKLNEIQTQRTDGNRLVLSSEQQDEINKFRDEERRIKVRRREVRKNLREDIEALGHRLIALNLLLLPMATTALGATVFMKRNRPQGRVRKGVTEEQIHG